MTAKSIIKSHRSSSTVKIYVVDNIRCFGCTRSVGYLTVLSLELGMLEDKYRTKVDFSGTKIKVIRSQANEGDNFKADYHVVLLSNGFVNSCNLFYCPFIFTFHSSLAIYF